MHGGKQTESNVTHFMHVPKLMDLGVLVYIVGICACKQAIIKGVRGSYTLYIYLLYSVTAVVRLRNDMYYKYKRVMLKRSKTSIYIQQLLYTVL